MTSDIAEMTAGRELDLLVADKVFGLKVRTRVEGGWTQYRFQSADGDLVPVAYGGMWGWGWTNTEAEARSSCPAYSSHHRAHWELYTKLIADGWSVTIRSAQVGPSTPTGVHWATLERVSWAPLPVLTAKAEASGLTYFEALAKAALVAYIEGR